ncbi:MAG: HAD family phosphatase [Clostridia bacterium]|nr:HAD family phosphatase [Clostridia bacterium]
MTELVIFDLDGTLLDTLPHWGRVNRLFVERVGAAADEQRLSLLDGLPFEEGVACLKREFGLPILEDKALGDLWIELAVPLFAADATLMPDVAETLARLRRDGVKTAIFSQSPRDLMERAVRESGLFEQVDAVFFAGETTHKKGDPAAFLELAARMNVSPQRTVVVDDAAYALRAAKEAGMEAVAVLYGNPEADQAAQAADRAIDRLSSL